MSDKPTEIILLGERTMAPNIGRSELDIVVELRCSNDTKQTAQGKALNLCIVLDRSGSMSGPKLETAKKSCVDIVGRLGADDKFSLIAFDSLASVVVNPNTPKSEIEQNIKALQSGGSTNLSLGWYLGLLELQTHATERHNSRLILLSDGQANQGETKRSVLAAEASRSRELGITSSTIGIGKDFQEDLLDAIAKESGGRFWYIEKQDVQDIIDEEFRGSLSVIVDRPRIELTVPTGVRVSKELNRETKVGNRYRVRPLKGKDLINFALRLEIDPQEVAKDFVEIGARLLDGERELDVTSLNIYLGAPDRVAKDPFNAVVGSVVRQFESSVSGEAALQAAADGDFDLMKRVLIENVNGMKIAADACAKQRNCDDGVDSRMDQELIYLSRELADADMTLTMLHFLDRHQKLKEVGDFSLRWRKLMHHNQHRNAARHNSHGSLDKENVLALLTGALALVVELRGRYSHLETQLIQDEEVLRAAMERYK